MQQQIYSLFFFACHRGISFLIDFTDTHEPSKIATSEIMINAFFFMTETEEKTMNNIMKKHIKKQNIFYIKFVIF